MSLGPDRASSIWDLISKNKNITLVYWKKELLCSQWITSSLIAHLQQALGLCCTLKCTLGKFCLELNCHPQQEDFCDPSPPHCVGIQYSRLILFWFFFSSLWILLLAIPVMSISLGESRLASNLLCSQEWPWSPDPPAFMLTLQACAATPSPVIKLNRKKIEIYNILSVVHNPFPQGLILSRNVSAFWHQS